MSTTTYILIAVISYLGIGLLAARIELESTNDDVLPTKFKAFVHIAYGLFWPVLVMAALLHDWITRS